MGGEQRKGYKESFFADAFKRYLIPNIPIQTVPAYQASNNKAFDVFQTVPQENVGTDEKQPKGMPIKACNVGTDEKPLWGKNTEEVF